VELTAADDVETPAAPDTDRDSAPDTDRDSAPDTGPGSMPLPAIEPEWARRARTDPTLLAEVAHAVGSPFHLLRPEVFAANLAAFTAALRRAGVAGQVYYGKKANKSGCWLAECARAGAGVDVASVPELVHALAGGVRGSDLVVTGAAKVDELLWLAARHGCLLTVDAPDELERVIRLSGEPGLLGPVRILLRVLPGPDPHSRFGFDARDPRGSGGSRDADSELDRALDRCVAARDRVAMHGFSFHLGGYAVAPRAAMAAELVSRCLVAREHGLVADAISIGGGFAVSYVPGEDWGRFTRHQRDDWFHAGRTFGHFYPYHQAPAGADMLAAILASPVPGHHDLAAALSSTGTRLLLEPGRALLDGAGFSVFGVRGVKRRDGYDVITVDGLSTSISEQWKNSEFLPDPLLWPAKPVELAEPDEPTAACVGGASCLEYDMLTWRKVRFPRRPRPGDLLVYPNTAGYQMDKNETEFHQLPVPARVVLTGEGERRRWRLERTRLGGYR
jgi:diaminopimelate decarboxylase